MTDDHQVVSLPNARPIVNERPANGSRGLLSPVEPSLSPPIRMMRRLIGSGPAEGEDMARITVGAGRSGAHSRGESAARDPGREAALVAVMTRLAEGDGAALYTLREQFSGELSRAVRGVARTRRAALSADEVDELVTDVVVELAGLAATWSPGGAPPWVWARHRVARVVDRHLGQWASPLEPDRAAAVADRAPAAGVEPPVLDVLASLARHHPRVALLREAVARVASGRDQEVFFETVVQVSLGDRSPAVTVGGLLGMRPEAVRQQHHRVRLRVQRLAANDPRFAALADLPVVA